jgi:hypothetical protein
LPFCLHVPDGEYLVKLSQNDAVALRLKKIVPKSYDERMGYRGIVDSDLHDICEVGLFSMEQNGEQAKNRSRIVEPKDLPEIGEFCHVIYVKDKNGKMKIAGREQCRGGPHGYSKSATGRKQGAHRQIGRTNNKYILCVYLGSFDARCAKSFG